MLMRLVLKIFQMLTTYHYKIKKKNRSLISSLGSWEKSLCIRKWSLSELQLEVFQISNFHLKTILLLLILTMSVVCLEVIGFLFFSFDNRSAKYPSLNKLVGLSIILSSKSGFAMKKCLAQPVTKTVAQVFCLKAAIIVPCVTQVLYSHSHFVLTYGFVLKIQTQ